MIWRDEVWDTEDRVWDMADMVCRERRQRISKVR